MTREEFLSARIKSLGTVKDFAIKINMPYTTLRSILTNVGGASIDNIIKICNGLNISTSTLEAISEKHSPEEQTEFSHKSKRKVARIPVLGRVAAGVPIEAIENIEDYEEMYINAFDDPHDYFALRIVGHSMEPRIWDGDVVIVHKQNDADNGKIAVVLVNGNDATVKQIKKSDSGITLIGMNPAVYSPHFYTAEEVIQLPVRILGVVCEVRGKI